MGMAETTPPTKSEITLKGKLASRKLILDVIAQVINFYLFYIGKLDAKVFSSNLVWLTMIYVWGEALADSGFLKGKGAKELISQMTPMLLSLVNNRPKPTDDNNGEG
jgi:hypothetical protein